MKAKRGVGSAEFTRRILDASPVGLVLSDDQGRIVMANVHAARVFGYGDDELVGKLVEDLVPPSAREAHRRHHAVIAAKSSHRPMGAGRDLRGLRKDGREVPLEIGLTPLSVGRRKYVLASVIDVSERLRIAAETSWRFVAVEQGPTAAMMTDLDGNITYVNQRFTEITGYAPGEVLGKNPRILRSGETHPAVYRDLWGTITAGRRWHGQIQNRRKDGSLYWHEIWVTPLRDAGGTVTHYLALQDDITQRVRSEATSAERERLAELGSDVGVALTKEVTLKTALRLCTEALVRHLDAAFARIWTLDASGQTLELQASAGQYTRLDGTHARVPVGAKKIGLIAAQRRPHMTNGVIGDPQVSEQEWAKREGMVAFAGFPLLVGGQLIGVVALFARHTLTESVFEALASVADVIAVGIRRNQVEATLRDREERFRQVTETMREVFYLVTANFQRTLYVSPAYETVWGTSRTALEANPRAFLDSVHPDDRAILQRDIERAQRGEPATESEFRIRRPDGTLRWILSRAVSVRNELGEVYRIAGVALDVTQRKQALDALRLNEERLRTLFEAVNLVVLGLDGRGTVNYVNPFFLKLSGYSQDQVLGRDWIADFLPERVRPQMQAAFGQLLQRAAAHAHYTNPIVTRSGEERLISWHNTVVRDASGRPTGTLSIGEDVTEHAQLEEQFRQAQKMEAVGRLAGGVAHDFNNVLTAVFGYVDLLKEQFAAGSPQREDLDEIRKAADRAAGLTRQLLAFSRQQVLEPVVMNPNSLIEDLEKMLRRVIGEDVQLSLRLAPKAGNVRVDPGQLQQVLLNLVVNARDAMPTGGTISITTAGADLPDVYGTPPQEVKSGPYIKLEVTDSGMGMSPETRTRIFEPFFTTKEKGKGTGLGLSTVYGIVKQSEGYIWVDSAEGRGTTFSVFLPRVDAPPQAPPARPTLATLAGTETVLLVEDDNLLRPLARNILATLGYTVLVAGNAHDAEGLAAGHQGPIHLLLTDVVMPGVSGADLAKRMKLARPDIRVLFMSGYLDDAIAQHGVLTPGTPFLHKPFSPQDLAKKVREVLG